MSRLFTPTLRISIGLAALTISLALCGYIFGLVPDETKAEIDARARVAEALAIQLSGAAGRNDVLAIQETISSVESRNSAVLSIALRRADGDILISSGDHGLHWVEPHDQRSTATHVQVPLFNGDAIWGKVEIAFRPLHSSKQFAGIPTALAGFIAFLGLMGFAGYYFVLRRALRELDPSRVIPDRVQAAFDTLAEGVIILDEREMVLLANNSFAESINETSESLFGTKISDLKWRQWSDNGAIGDYPWRIALREKKSVTAVPLGIRIASGDIRSLMVNATCIVDGKDTVSGTIVTFDDVSALERKNEELNRVVRQLEETEEEISRQNRHLQYLANHDPLSGCLNRRAFFAEFETSLERANRLHQPLCCLMVDLDHFKSINDCFGHAVGDEVIAGMADILKSNCGEADLVGRYGGEEFCVSLFGLTLDNAKQLAEQIRREVAIRSQEWLQKGEKVTVSIGLAVLPDDSLFPMDLVNRADQALYAAKTAGRDRVVCWDEMAPDAKASPMMPTPLRRSTDIVNAAAPDPSHMRETTRSGDMQASETVGLTRLESPPGIDPLTQLPTRVIFMDRVSQSIARAERDHKIVAILHVSIDSYERFTEIFGGAASQRLINAVGDRLSKILRRTDTVSLVGSGYRVPTISRLGGEKFAIEVSDVDETDTVTWIIKRAFESLSRPFNVDGEKAYVNCSIGVSVYPGDGTDAETLVRHASVAERHARESHGNDTHMFFSKAMNESSRRQVMLEAGIKQALENDELTLHYQPIIDARTGRLSAAEALLRCDNQNLAGIPIGLLISIAEQTGLMSQIGEWVIKTATGQMQEWLDNGLDLPKISVNVSAIQLRDSKAIERLVQIVTDMDLEPRKLQLEITETAMLQDIDAASETLKRLQQLGVQIALDDFGTGQSSLTYLRRFRPDVLKIDRSFIDEIDTNRADGTLVSAVVAMSHSMGLRVVAEGVETTVQMDCVRTLGCDEIQGYLIAKPMPATVMSDWLRLFAAKDLMESGNEKRSKLWENSQSSDNLEKLAG